MSGWKWVSHMSGQFKQFVSCWLKYHHVTSWYHLGPKYTPKRTKAPVWISCKVGDVIKAGSHTDSDSNSTPGKVALSDWLWQLTFSCGHAVQRQEVINLLSEDSIKDFNLLEDTTQVINKERSETERRRRRNMRLVFVWQWPTRKSKKTQNSIA